MLLTALNGQRPFQPRRSGSGVILPSPRAIARLTASVILFASCAPFGAATSRAQDQQDPSVAEAARQARAKKQQAHKTSKHVYTEEDLKRPNILTPEDRAQIEAKRNECAQKNNCSPDPSQHSPAALDANSETPATSLGEVARQYRKQKELRDQKQKELQALKPKHSEPFHLPFSTPALASPILPERPAIHPPAPPVRPEANSKRPRRDPFARVRVSPNVNVPESPRSEISRPEVRTGVRRPEVSLPEPSRHDAPSMRVPIGEALAKVRPSFGRPVRPTAPVHPKGFPRPTPPALFARPVLPNNFALPVPTTILARPVQPVAPIIKIARPAQSASSLLSAETRAQKSISVQPGDSLWKLAHRTLGNGSRWPEILTANPWITNPNEIRSGARLILPAVVAARQIEDGSNKSIKVHQGDTLWTLAKANLGHSSAWSCLAAANPSIANPDRIFEGQELTVPSACPAEPRSVVSPAHP